jgi:hypothetical protein
VVAVTTTRQAAPERAADRAAVSPAGPDAVGRHRRRHEEQPVSYYGRPILKKPPWEPLDVGGYLFLGGLAGASSLLAAGAQATGRPDLARVAKVGAVAAVSLSLAALVHDLGRPLRFVNMLRVAKPTSPMSMGSWLLTGYAPAALAAAASDLSGVATPLGTAATAVAAAAGPAVASYTAVLLADTAVPAWHDAYRRLPFLFAGSAAASAGAFGMVAAPVVQSGPARRLAVAGAAAEILAGRLMRSDPALTARPYREGKGGNLLTLGERLTAGGGLLAVIGGRRRPVAVAAGAALLAGSACTRLGVFHAGVESTQDPEYVVGPQRLRTT